jgi:hypothetical protein
MKFETIRNTIKVKLFAAAVLAVGLFASTGYAQTDYSGRFTLPAEVHWGRTVLPAGQYSIRMEPFGVTAKVMSADGKIAFFTPIGLRNLSKKGAAGLTVLVSGNNRTVLSLNLPERDISLVYHPVSPAERELLAKTDQPAPVPIIAAK